MSLSNVLPCAFHHNEIATTRRIERQRERGETERKAKLTKKQANRIHLKWIEWLAIANEIFKAHTIYPDSRCVHMQALYCIFVLRYLCAQCTV